VGKTATASVSREEKTNVVSHETTQIGSLKKETGRKGMVEETATAMNEAPEAIISRPGSRMKSSRVVRINAEMTVAANALPALKGRNVHRVTSRINSASQTLREKAR
jgi:hypothetical protein